MRVHINVLRGEPEGGAPGLQLRDIPEDDLLDAADMANRLRANQIPQVRNRHA